MIVVIMKNHVVTVGNISFPIHDRRISVTVKMGSASGLGSRPGSGAG